MVTQCFENRFLSFSISYNLTTIVIIYMLNVMDSLSIFILRCIYYSPISIILGGEMQLRKDELDFEWNLYFHDFARF